ncbi:substrate-binding periplasmic protein [Allohahella marinimesophila]|uniref:Transporter substrate-binding domain-containing protein n=1 Tax=Allohahella marinimesophila TaxID=1054972 RepID=A0ABP7NKG0_9GAMM
MFRQLLLFFCVLIPMGVAAQVPSDRLLDRPLHIVTEEWKPYVYSDAEGQVRGSDWEVVEAVFRKLGVDVTLEFCPWKRCLALMKSKDADAILGASFTEDRAKFLVYPDEPLSTALTGIFVRRNAPIEYRSLASLKALRGGAMLGYEYCPEISAAELNLERERQLAANFAKLALQRIDYVIANLVVGHQHVKELNLLHRIQAIPGAHFCAGESNYLPFAQKPDLGLLIKAFDAELRFFKTTREFHAIQTRYGMPDSALANH